MKPNLVYMLKRIKVHLEPDKAEAAFQPNEAMDQVIAELGEIADSLIANGYSSNLYKIANRLAGKERT